MKFSKIKKFEHFFNRIPLYENSLDNSPLDQELLNNQDFPTVDDVIDYMLEFIDKEEINILNQKQYELCQEYNSLVFLSKRSARIKEIKLYTKNLPTKSQNKNNTLHSDTKALVYLRLNIPRPPEMESLNYSKALNYIIDKLQSFFKKFVLRSGHLVNISAAINIGSTLGDPANAIVRIEFLK